MIELDSGPPCPFFKQIHALLAEAGVPLSDEALGHNAFGLWHAFLEMDPSLRPGADLAALAVGRWLRGKTNHETARNWVRFRVGQPVVRAHLDWLLALPRLFGEGYALVASRSLRWKSASPWHPEGVWEVHLDSLSEMQHGGFDLALMLTGNRLARLLSSLREARDAGFAVVLVGGVDPQAPLPLAVRSCLEAADIPLVCRLSA